MNREDRGPVALLMATSALLGAALYFSAPASADGYLDDSEADYVDTYGDGAICPFIDLHDADGVVAAVETIVDDGFAVTDAIDVVNASVWLHCPRNWPLLVAMGNAARSEGTVA
jgi:hypothetical protein